MKNNSILPWKLNMPKMQEKIAYLQGFRQLDYLVHLANLQRKNVIAVREFSYLLNVADFNEVLLRNYCAGIKSEYILFGFAHLLSIAQKSGLLIINTSLHLRINTQLEIIYKNQ